MRLSGPIRFVKQPSPLKVWVPPVDAGDLAYSRFRYFIGADPSRGQAKSDFAAAVVWCGETGEQCARYANRVNPQAFASFLNLIGRYYNNAMVAVELTGNLGLWVQKSLRDDWQYPNLYRWKGRDDRQPVGYVQRNAIGWETNVRTREILITEFRTAVQYRRCVIYDAALVTQMEQAERNESRAGSWEITEGHDDILIAAMIGWVARSQWFSGGTINIRTRQLATEPDVDVDSNPKQLLPNADLDVAGTLQRHWKRLQHLIKHGHPKDRLQGL